MKSIHKSGVITDIEKLAPISVTVYTRLAHFRQCIESLVRNDTADQSTLYIFSDAAKPGDEAQVKMVREYAESISGFKEVRLKFQEENNYLKNMRDARTIPINQYGKVIRLEDDIVTAPGFLNFINGALQFYEGEDQVLNVAGYAPPIPMPHDYANDYFTLPRPSAWGWGYDRRTLKVVNARISEREFRRHRTSEILKRAGNDVLPMLEKSVSGDLVAGDVRAMFHQLVTGKLTIYPRKSLVQNIGFDGSGVHCGTTDRFSIDSLWDKEREFIFLEDVMPHPEILRANYKFRSSSIRSRALAKLRRWFS